MELTEVKGKRRKVKGLLFACLGSCLLILGSASFAGAQSFSFSDLFGQGSKELKNMVAQLSAMNAFIRSTEQGYRMLHSEWSAIGNWKNGEFGLHQEYYGSLAQVSVPVRQSPDVVLIGTEQQAILGLWSALSGMQGLGADERSYVQSVSAGVLKGCNADLLQLQQVLQAGTLTMSDDERLKLIARLQADMLDKYRFTQSFCNSVRLLVVQRNAENNELLNLNPLYENND